MLFRVDRWSPEDFRIGAVRTANNEAYEDTDMFGPLLGFVFIVYVISAVFKGGGGDTRVKHGRGLSGRKYKTVNGPCFRCDGTGQVHGQTCRKCGGSGRFSQTYWS